MTTILIGGTGLIGSHTIQLFSSFFPKDKLICPVRSLPKELAYTNPKKQKQSSPIEYLEFDFEDPKNLKKIDWKNVDSIICTLGTTIKKSGKPGEFQKSRLRVSIAFR